MLAEIRNLLQEHGRLDVNNPMNDFTQYPNGAYSQLEYLLLRLELLWYFIYLFIYSSCLFYSNPFLLSEFPCYIIAKPSLELT